MTESGMPFAHALLGLTRDITVSEAQNAIRAAQGRKATRWVSANTGLSIRQSQRWMSDAPPASREQNIINLAYFSAIAHRVATHAKISVGTVWVTYNGVDRSHRNVSDISVSDIPPKQMSAFRDALLNADPNASSREAILKSASENLAKGILEAYGSGLSDTLTIISCEDELSL